MLTQRLFHRAAYLAAQGQFSEQEAAAVLRHITIYDTRPSVFDALLILSPISDPSILLRFLKSYRHQDILDGLALMKECGRGDLSAVETSVLTMYPQRILPTDGYGRRTSRVSASGLPHTEAEVGPDGVAFDTLSRSIEKSLGRFGVSGSVQSQHVPDLINVHSNFPLSSLTVKEVQDIVVGNHSEQKTPEEMLAAADERSRRISAMEALGYSEEMIVEKLSELEKDSSAEVDHELRVLLGGRDSSREVAFEEKGGSKNVFKSANSDPIILDIDKKWSGLMEAAAEVDGLKPRIGADDGTLGNIETGEYGGCRDVSSPIPLEGLSPAEAAIIEEERRAVEAFERSTGLCDKDAEKEIRHHSFAGSSEEKAAEKQRQLPQEIEQDLMTNSAESPSQLNNKNNTSINGNGNATPSEWVSTSTSSPQEPSVCGANPVSDTDAVIPVCPPLAPTPLKDFDAFFRTRVMKAAERTIRQNKKGVITHERFFVLAKSIAQMQSICPEAMSKVVDRALEIVDKVLDGREELWTTTAHTVGLKGSQKRAALRRAEEMAAERKRRLVASAAAKSAETTDAPHQSTSAVDADLDRDFDFANKDGDGSNTSSTASPSAKSTSSDLTDAVLKTMDPKAAFLTPTFAVSVVAGALDFFALALATNNVPSHDARSTRRKLEGALLRPVSFGVTSDVDTEATVMDSADGAHQKKEALLAPQNGGAKANSEKNKTEPRPFTTATANLSLHSPESINVLTGLHRGVYITAVAVINMCEHASLRDISRALAAHVSMIKTGFAIDRSIPMAHLIIAAAHERLDCLLGSIPNGKGPAGDLEHYISLVGPIRALCSSNRFPDARLLRVKLATVLQDCIFDADDETFYRFCPIAIPPESGTYSVANMTGAQRLRLSRVLAFADSAFHRPVPPDPRRLATSCDLLRSVGRRRFGLARYAVYMSSRSSPRTLRDFVDLGRMVQYASIHPELFNRAHGGFNKILYINCSILQTTNVMDEAAAAELSGLKRFEATAGEATDGSSASTTDGQSSKVYGLVIPMTPLEVLKSEVGGIRRKSLETSFGDSAVQNELKLRDTEDLVIENRDSLDNDIKSRRVAFGVRLFHNVGPYRSGLLAAFANEPFLLNWFIANQTALNLSTIIASLRIIAKSETFLIDQRNQTLSKARIILHESEKKGGGDDATGREKDAKTKGGLKKLAGSVPSALSPAVAAMLLRMDSTYEPQYRQLLTFLLALVRFRLSRLHNAAFFTRADKDKTASGAQAKINSKSYSIRNRGAANIFKAVADEALSIASMFESLPEIAKVHVRAIMTIAQRTNNASYGSLIIEHGEGFLRVVSDEGSNAHANTLEAKLNASKKAQKHISLNFNQLLDPQSLSETYTPHQMIRLIGLLHEYHIAYGAGIGTAHSKKVDSGRTVLPEHWDKVLKGLKHRVLSDEADLNQTMGTAFIRVASRIVHDTLSMEEASLRSFRLSEMDKIRKEEGITDLSALWKRVADKKLPAELVDPNTEKAIQSLVSMARWLSITPPEDSFVFSAESVCHFFKMLCVPLGVKAISERSLNAGHNPFIYKQSATSVSPRGKAPKRGLQISFRVAMARHFTSHSLHYSRVNGTLIPADLFLSMAKQAAFSANKKKTFDAETMRFLCDVADGRHPKAFDILRMTFQRNCHKPAGSWGFGASSDTGGKAHADDKKVTGKRSQRIQFPKLESDSIYKLPNQRTRSGDTEATEGRKRLRSLAKSATAKAKLAKGRLSNSYQENHRKVEDF